MADDDIKYEEEFVLNARGMNLFTCQWRPSTNEPKALIFLCHGYAMECSISMRGTGTRLAQAGFAVHGMDYEGHGKSSGLQGYITSFNDIVVDCSKYFASVCEKLEYKNQRRFLLGESMGGAIVLMLHRKEPTYWDGAILVAPMCKVIFDNLCTHWYLIFLAIIRPRFLVGESMGGAVALLLHRARPDFWTGVVLVAPMCKIADDMRPHPVVVNILRAMTSIIPTWKVVPTADVIDAAYRMQEKRDEIRGNPYCYKDKPRLKTAFELLKVSLDVEANLLHKVSLPFLIVHGGADKVTDPSVSELLYQSAASQDKTLKLYPGMWHALTSGESPNNIRTVFQDIIAWLDHRSLSLSMEDQLPTTELEQKARHDDQQLQHPGNSSKYTHVAS